jgi:cytochrome c553
MKSRSLVILVIALGCLSVAVAYNTAASLDGINPPHALDTAGKTIPDSSATQPDKPIILSKDSNDPKWGEFKPDATFDHTKHNTDVTHTLDGKTLTACVYCHHTEQPMPVAGKPYLKKSVRTEVLTAAQLETSKQAVNSCRHCHFQEATAATDEFPPKSVKYPREMGLPPSGKLTNDNAYHLRCIACHDAAMKRDSKLKAPQGCGDCHSKK